MEITADVSVTSTNPAAPDTVITGGSHAYDGATRVCIEFYASDVASPSVQGGFILITLWDGATDLGRIISLRSETTEGAFQAGYGRRFLTPSNATHQYLIKARVTTGTGTVGAGAGGADTPLPAFLRISTA